MLKVITAVKSVCKTGAYAFSTLGPNLVQPKVQPVPSISEQKVRVDIGRDVVDINYVRSGHPSGKHALILMPGALGSAWTDFKPQIELLPALLPDTTVIAIDPVGYGKSIPPTRTFGLDFFENDAKDSFALMRTLGFDQFSILGWSDGGISGLILAAKFPEAVQRLVIWGANAYVSKHEIEVYRVLRHISNWTPILREPMEKLYGLEYFTKTLSDLVDAFEDIYEKRKGDLCRNLLKNIQAPTLIVHGTKDRMIAPEQVPHLLEHVKGSELALIEKGKHDVHLRFTEEFNKIVAEYLKKELFMEFSKVSKSTKTTSQLYN